MQAVSKQVHLNISEIRVYRLGKQINTQIFHKTISQMQMLGNFFFFFFSGTDRVGLSGLCTYLNSRK